MEHVRYSNTDQSARLFLLSSLLCRISLKLKNFSSILREFTQSLLFPFSWTFLKVEIIIQKLVQAIYHHVGKPQIRRCKFHRLNIIFIENRSRTEESKKHLAFILYGGLLRLSRALSPWTSISLEWNQGNHVFLLEKYFVGYEKLLWYHRTTRWSSQCYELSSDRV